MNPKHFAEKVFGSLKRKKTLSSCSYHFTKGDKVRSQKLASFLLKFFFEQASLKGKNLLTLGAMFYFSLKMFLYRFSPFNFFLEKHVALCWKFSWRWLIKWNFKSSFHAKMIHNFLCFRSASLRRSIPIHAKNMSLHKLKICKKWMSSVKFTCRNLCKNVKGNGYPSKGSNSDIFKPPLLMMIPSERKEFSLSLRKSIEWILSRFSVKNCRLYLWIKSVCHWSVAFCLRNNSVYAHFSCSNM